MHIKQSVEFVGRLFGAHVRDAFLQAIKLFDHRVTASAGTRNLGAHLVRLDEVMRHIHPARRHHHRAANGHTA